MAEQEMAGKVALVTGSSRGLGKAIAIKLGSMGAKIAVNYVSNEESAAVAVREIAATGGEACAFKADVSDAAAVKAMVREITDKWGKTDILVNNAGVTRDQLLPRMSEDAWDTVLDTHLKGAYLCTRFALRSMMAQGWGRIINIASVAGIIGNAGQANYSAAKGGLIALTKSAARELGPVNITVNAIAPGFIVTDMTDSMAEEWRELVLERIPLKRYGQPSDVAELVAFLASDRASYITAQIISIDGGLT